MYLNRDQILSATDLPTRDVPTPEWGGTVRVRTLTGRERDAFENRVSGRGGNLVNVRAYLASLCVVGEDGKPLFTAEDVKALGEKSAVALDRIFDVCMELNAMRKADVEREEGNSGAAPSGCSGSS